MRKGLTAIVTVIAVLATAAPALAWISVDRSFGKHGRVVESSGGADWFTDVEMVGTDMVAVGRWDADRVIIAKYDTSGSPVKTFGHQGRRIIDLGPAAGAASVIIEPSGNLLVTCATSRGFALVRLTADGNVVRSFGRRGVVKVDTLRYYDIDTSQDAQGRTLVAIGEMTARDDSTSRVHVWRFKTNGDPDRSFDGGAVTSSPSKVNMVTGLAVDTSGRVFLATAQFSQKNPKAGMSLLRISESGNTVRVIRRLSAWDQDGTYPVGLSIRDDHTLLVGITGSRSPRIGSAAYTTDGRPVRSYAGDGIVLGRCTAPCYPVDQNVDSRGRLVLVGGSDTVADNNNGSDATWLARFTADGRFDRRFGLDGLRVMNLYRGFDIGYSVTAAANGRLLVAGRITGKGDAVLTRMEN